MSAALVSWVVWTTCWLGSVEPIPPTGSFLYQLVPGPEGIPRPLVEAYTPAEGDLVFYDDHRLYWHVLYRLTTGNAFPTHAGIVVRLPDGRLMVLEAGPDYGPYVSLFDVQARWSRFRGTIWIRRLSGRLSPEQSAALTGFALAQLGKRYAYGRLVLQSTPFRARGQVRSHLWGRTWLDRRSWLCSELVVAAGTAADLFDPDIHRANTIYPWDLVDDHRFDLKATWQPPAIWAPCPPAGLAFPR